MTPPPQTSASTSEEWETLEQITQDQLDAMAELHERFLTGRLGGRRIHLKNTNLSGLSLKGRKLRQAQFMSCVMREMNLAGADFAEAALYACDLSHANLAGAAFVRADLRGTRIESANLKNADFERADLRAGGVTSKRGEIAETRVVDFSGANLSGARLMGSMASKANFSDAIMSRADMSRADLRGAKLEGADLSGAEIRGAQMGGANLKSAILTGIDSASLAAAHVDPTGAITDDNIGMPVMEMAEPLSDLITAHRLWVESAGEVGKQLDLSHVDMRFLKSLDHEKLTAMRASSAKFFGMTLTSVEMQSAVMDGSDFRNCDMTGADLRGSSFKGCNFSHTILRAMNGAPLLFGEGATTRNFSPCSFEGAVMRYADAGGAMLKSALFRGADLSYADFSGADLREADFSGAVMHETVFDGAQTQGAYFDRRAGAFNLGALQDTEED